MDFTKLMSSQIAKASKSVDMPIVTAKYLKRGEEEAAREKAYREEQASRIAGRINKADRKRKAEDDEREQAQIREQKRQKLAEETRKRREDEERQLEKQRRKRLGLPKLTEQVQLSPDESEATSKNVTDNIQDISAEELMLKLRALNHPAILFGESHPERLRRYHFVVNPPIESLPLVKDTRIIPTTLEPLPGAELIIATKVPPSTDIQGRTLLARRLTSWFNLILSEWAVALAARDSSTVNTFTGQAALASQKQAIAHLTPLFRKLEKLPQDPTVLPDDLLEPMAEIVCAAQERRYVDANDGYLQLSIGKAAWPIGVTMVGIHERSAREKLHETDKGKAHIMSDESTRKILQSIKRCLSFAQVRWPPEDLAQLMG